MTTEQLKEAISYVATTRRYGQCYVRKDFREAVKERWNCIPGANIEGKPVTLSYSGWGKSLESGGHKYKMHARFSETSKPVPSKSLGLISL